MRSRSVGAASAATRHERAPVAQDACGAGRSDVRGEFDDLQALDLDVLLQDDELVLQALELVIEVLALELRLRLCR